MRDPLRRATGHYDEMQKIEALRRDVHRNRLRKFIDQSRSVKMPAQAVTGRPMPQHGRHIRSLGGHH